MRVGTKLAMEEYRRRWQNLQLEEAIICPCHTF
jgi:hypothetical protein